MFFKKISIAAITCLISAVLLTGTVFASTGHEINLWDSQSVGLGKTCQCETTVYSVIISNSGEFEETIHFTGSGEKSQWVTLAPENITLQPQKESSIYLYLTPDCYATPGNYTYTLNATTDSGTQDYMNLDFEVEQCHRTGLSVNPESATIPLCEEKQFDLEIINNGEFSEILNISAHGVPDEWITLPETRIKVEPGETKTLDLIVKSDCYADEKEYSLNIEAASKTEIKKATLDFTLINIHSISLEPSDGSNRISVCDIETASKTVTVTNLGTHSDRINIYSTGADWAAFESDELILKSGETKEIPFNISPPKGFTGETNIILYAKSQIFEGKTIIMPLLVNTAKCFDAKIEIIKSAGKTCRKTTAQYTFEVKNTGKKEDTYEFLIANANAVISQEKSTLLPDETTEINMEIDTSDLESGKNIFIFEATSKNVSKTLAVILEIEECHGLDIAVYDPIVCPGFENIVKGKITNLGTNPDSYSLTITGDDWITLDKKTIALESGASEDIILTVSPPMKDENKVFSLQIKAESENETSEKDFHLTVRTNTECCNSEIKITPLNLFVEEGGKGEKILVEIKNTGLRHNIFDLELSGPAWAYMNASSVAIPSKQKAEIWIYVAPPLDTPQKEFALCITASSDCSETTKKSIVAVREHGALFGKLEFDVNETQTLFEVNATQTIKIAVKNIGLKQLYNLKAEFSDEFDFNSTKISVLDPNEEKTLFVTVTPKTTETGEFEGKAMVVSDEQVLIKYFDYSMLEPTIRIKNVSGQLEQTDGKNTIMLEFEIENTSNEKQTIESITIGSDRIIYTSLKNMPLTISANTIKTLNVLTELPSDLNASFELIITATLDEKQYFFKDTVEFQETETQPTGLFGFMESPVYAAIIVAIVLIVSFLIAIFLTNGKQKPKAKPAKISARQIRETKENPEEQATDTSEDEKDKGKEETPN
ncbi:MAG: hypothetical protein J7K00_02180 [Candidatus Diapherotrites archaeon]|nr:hypothetical protein [Candidatus Diapherotrites archaeon]